MKLRDYDEVSRKAVNMLLQRQSVTATRKGKRWWQNLIKGLLAEIAVNEILQNQPVTYRWDGLQDYLRTLKQRTDYRSTCFDFPIYIEDLSVYLEAKDIEVPKNGPYGLAKAEELFLHRFRQHPNDEKILYVTHKEAFNAEVWNEADKLQITVVTMLQGLATVLNGIFETRLNRLETQFAVQTKLEELHGQRQATRTKPSSYYPYGVVEYPYCNVGRILNVNERCAVSKTINSSNFSIGFRGDGLDHQVGSKIIRGYGIGNGALLVAGRSSSATGEAVQLQSGDNRTCILMSGKRQVIHRTRTPHYHGYAAVRRFTMRIGALRTVGHVKGEPPQRDMASQLKPFLVGGYTSISIPQLS